AEIAVMGPEDFADFVQSFGSGAIENRQTPEGLARALREAVKIDPLSWASGLAQHVMRLRHPTYVSAIVEGLRSALSETGHLPLPWDEVIDGLAQVVDEPWPVEPLAPSDWDYETSWRNAGDSVSRLLRESLDGNQPLGLQVPRIYELLLKQMRKTDEPSGVGVGSVEDIRDGLMSAVNKPSTVALEGLYSLFLFAHRHDLRGDWGDRFYQALDEELDHSTEENLLASHVMAPRVAQYVALYEPGRQQIRRLLGDPTGLSLRVGVIETLLTFGRPQNPPFLGMIRPYLFAYLNPDLSRDEQGVRRAAQWLVIGYLWGAEGFDLDILMSTLQYGRALSLAAEAYGRILSAEEGQSTPDDEHKALAFWDAALAAADDSAQLHGFGWWSEGSLPDGDWLERMLDTLQRTDGRIDWDHAVAERLASLPPGDASLMCLRLMVKGATDYWALRYWSDHIRRSLEASRSDPALDSGRRDLVEALLEREFLEFRDFLPTSDG
ncbi:MAG TPA: hypothetical protein VGC11_15565, partial [Acidimicrobiia bacterium]